jgi:hypothetical protein
LAGHRKLLSRLQGNRALVGQRLDTILELPQAESTSLHEAGRRLFPGGGQLLKLGSS